MNIEVLDFVGEWTEVKLDIIKEYCKAYSKILSAQSKLKFYYIDAFAGAGMHRTKKEKILITGSPTNALRIEPHFNGYCFIDIDKKKIETLKDCTEVELRTYKNLKQKVEIIKGDCNEVLIEKIFPNLEYSSYRRALCILDPYGLDLEWEVLKRAGELRTIDIFLNFPIMDMNRNILLRNKEPVDPRQKERMTRFWGDDSWINAAYSTEGNLFGWPEKQTNDTVAEAFRRRLKEVAGFKCVPSPVAMKNSTDGTIYYLFFASQKNVAAKIAGYIFKKYKKP